MKNTKTYSGSFAWAKFQANSRGLLAVTLAAVIGLSMAACQNDLTDGEDPNQEEKKQSGENLFLGEWEGSITSSTYESYGAIPVDFTITEEGWFLEVMGQSGEGTYTHNGNVITIFYYGDPVGSCTLNAAGEIVIHITDESFGTVSGILKRKTSKPPVDPAESLDDPSLALTVVFKNAEDAQIIMNEFVLDEKDDLVITIEENFAAYEWYINNKLADDSLVSNGGKTIALSGGGIYLNIGNNRLSVKVTTNDGVIYSKTVIFTVE